MRSSNLELDGPLADLGRRARQFHYAWVELAFGGWLAAAPPLERLRLREALIAVCDVQAWWILSHDLELSRAEVRATLVLTIIRLLGEEPWRFWPVHRRARSLVSARPDPRPAGCFGHSIAVRTLASEVELMSARGFDAASIAPVIEAMQHDDYRARTPAGEVKRGMATFGRRSRHEVTDLRAAIDAEQPDAILVDCMTWGATTVAESWGGPWAVVSLSTGDDLARRSAVRTWPQARRRGRRTSSRPNAPPDPGRSFKTTAASCGPRLTHSPTKTWKWLRRCPRQSSAAPCRPTLALSASSRMHRFSPGQSARVTHGGAGATQKALAAGVPVCVVPFGRVSAGSRRRVETADAGTRLPAQKLNSERLRTQIRRAMNRLNTTGPAASPPATPQPADHPPPPTRSKPCPPHAHKPREETKRIDPISEADPPDKRTNSFFHGG